MPLVDLCTILPAFVMLLPGTGNIVSFLRVLRVVRSLRILRSFRMIGDNLRPSRRALAELALMCVCSLFIFATLFQLTETQFYPDITNNPNPNSSSEFKVDFGEAVYFGVIVLCTVGYGDLYAQTFWGNISQNYDEKVLYPKGPVTPGGITDRLLSDYPNMYGDLSAGSGLQAFLRDEDHARAFFSRHQDKLLYGSDCSDPVGHGPACSGIQQIASVRRFASDKKAERKLLFNNARRVLKLKNLG
jgi:hypothetical protein